MATRAARNLTAAAGLLAVWLLAGGAVAHPISVTQARVFIARDEVTVTIEIFAEDLFFYHSLRPDSDNYLSAADLKAAIEKHKELLLKWFVVLDVHGEPLEGEVVGVEPFRMGPRGLGMGELMANSVYYDLEFKLSRPPEFLTFILRIDEAEAVVPAIMQLSVKQEGSPKQRPVELSSDMAHTIRFDWTGPPPSPGASRAERAKWNERAREETLGITSYSSVYSFIYINDFEVRHEILVPFLTMETWLPVERKDKSYLEIDEQDAARRAIEEFFTQAGEVEIDGIQVRPVVARIDFYGLKFRDFAQMAPRRRVNVATARVGVILSYSTKGPPEHVKITWDEFNWQVWELRSVVLHTRRP